RARGLYFAYDGMPRFITLDFREELPDHIDDEALVLPLRYMPKLGQNPRDPAAGRDPPRMFAGAVRVALSVNGEHRAANGHEGALQSPVRESGRQPRLDPRTDDPLGLAPVVFRQLR